MTKYLVGVVVVVLGIQVPGIGWTLFDATNWPGAAAVTVSVVHGAKESPSKNVKPILDGKNVADINSRLRPKPERQDAIVLDSNRGRALIGSKVYGQGFTLTPEERDALVQKNPKNVERIFPYLGGEEVNTSPT